MLYRFADCELDADRFELRRNGEPVRLERQVFGLLAYVVEQHDRLVSKGELLDKVWGDRFVTESALNSRVMAARKAIGDNGKDQRLIKTMHGRGYRFVEPVTSERPTPAKPPETTSRSEWETGPREPGGREQHIRFCSAPDGVRLAYATVGAGPPLVKAANWLSHLEFDWRSPVWRHWIEELSRDHTLVRYDPRGIGLSDWDVEDVSWEARLHDLEVVVDALGLERFPILGISGGGSLAIAYAVRHPERVTRLVLYGAYAQGWRRRTKTPAGLEEEEAIITLMRAGWGRDNPSYRQIFASEFIPGATWEHMRWFNDLCRVSASGDNAVRFRRVSGEIDVTELLPLVSVPTLVLHARHNQAVPFEQGRLLAAGIPRARFVSLESQNHILLESEEAWKEFLREVRAFLGAPLGEPAIPTEQVQTILFTDLEGSTELTHRLGDRASRELFREYEGIVRECLAIHGGSEVKTMGDGFMAAFRSPTRALECAVAVQAALADRDPAMEPLRVRIGLHTGEPLAEGGDFFGSAVILAARIAAEARGGEILVSDVVRQLTAGKGFSFAERGQRTFKGFTEPTSVFELLWKG